MENVLVLGIPLLLLVILLRVMILPVKLVWKIAINSVCGFLCLWLINSLSALTGLTIPVNPVTAAVAGFLGLPGIGLLAVVQMMF